MLHVSCEWDGVHGVLYTQVAIATLGHPLPPEGVQNTVYPQYTNLLCYLSAGICIVFFMRDLYVICQKGFWNSVIFSLF